MWYYVTVNGKCIGIYNNIEEVNHFLARNGYTVISLEQRREFKTIIEVAYF